MAVLATHVAPSEIRRPAVSHRPGTLQTVVRTLDLRQWAGRWVAVDSADLVRCTALTLAELLDVLASADLGEVEVMRAPAPDEPVVYGLG
jgi:hypothetical protein